MRGLDPRSGWRPVIALRKTAVVITVSDSAHLGRREDLSGPLARKSLESLGLDVDGPLVVPDEADRISEILIFSSARADLVVTTGGTGLGPRDVTPEATRRVIDREAPGLAEMIRLRGLDRTVFASLSRGICGLRGRSLIVNLPGSPRGVAEGLRRCRRSFSMRSISRPGTPSTGQRREPRKVCPGFRALVVSRPANDGCLEGSVSNNPVKCRWSGTGEGLWLLSEKRSRALSQGFSVKPPLILV